ncbi:hypothetical protein F1559_004694 [Cyanidiococcus yangmingshanensis]|uniref:GST N-terminal domain-containing protein n=1 Tax=Cyanidiococcus yangmingshanensis TaxID=2690220 RepID=A0A7J7IMG3_9RHOD|nr:hypothetical protein F1559_004694 [Cyanidiococcus yangmingshanensis]
MNLDTQTKKSIQREHPQARRDGALAAAPPVAYGRRWLSRAQAILRTKSSSSNTDDVFEQNRQPLHEMVFIHTKLLQSTHGFTRKRSWCCATRARVSKLNSAVMNSTGDGRTTTLFSVPVSNFSARIRYLIYDNNLDIKIEPPGPYLKTPEYRQKVHKYGKFPALILPTGESIWESDVIAEYLIDRYHLGARYRPETAEKRARARLYARVHDLYLTSHQTVLYRPTNTEAEREHWPVTDRSHTWISRTNAFRR